MSAISDSRGTAGKPQVSVIMPVERFGGDADRAIASVLQQDTGFPFELIVVSAEALPLPADDRVRNVIETDRNPATRRNRAASEAGGSILAFIDDDAQAAPDWLATAASYLAAHGDVLGLGGPDPAPLDSTEAELIAETLLATPLVGSGIACHEDRAGVFDIRSPSDIALVNLFVRREVFDGFDESIGYIGEDSALIENLMARGRVVYHHDVRVHHRRRAFPGPYLRQRWRYRVKTGQLFVRRSRAHRNPKVSAFLVAGTFAIVFAPVVIIPYVITMLVLGVGTTRLRAKYWPFLPVAFALHHATYYFGILWGMVKGSFARRR